MKEKIELITRLAEMPIESVTPEMIMSIMADNEYSSSIWTITPTIASVLLKANIKNRVLRRSYVELYKTDLRNKTWKENGESICFKKDGQLSDGQHRLAAISETDMAVKINVAVGCDNNSDHTYDSGLNRTIKDAFKYNDIPLYIDMAAIISKYFVLKREAPFISNKKYNAANNNQVTGHITRSVLLSEAENNKNFYSQIARSAQSVYKRSRLLRKSEIGGMMAYLIKDMGYRYSFVEEFFNGLTTDGWVFNKPVANLRIRLMRDLANKNTSMSRQYKQALVIKTWNLYARGVNSNIRPVYNEKKEGKVWFVRAADIQTRTVGLYNL